VVGVLKSLDLDATSLLGEAIAVTELATCIKTNTDYIQQSRT
jgi:hypothetical protein